MVAITDSGNRTADLERGDRFVILSELSENSPQSVGSLARSCRMDIFRTSKIIAQLQRQGKVNTREYDYRED